jgi:hypothetical protein
MNPGATTWRDISGSVQAQSRVKQQPLLQGHAGIVLKQRRARSLAASIRAAISRQVGCA